MCVCVCLDFDVKFRPRSGDLDRMVGFFLLGWTVERGLVERGD